MDELIKCRCGHSIAAHSADGCESRRVGRCPCSLGPAEVLEKAVYAVRTQYGQWSDAG